MTARALAVGLGILSIGCLVWILAQARMRPPEYAEACVLFNAARIRADLPLYVDPVVGALDYGAPPSRFFVAYTPFYSGLLALLPPGLALATARLAGALAWFASLAIHAHRARPGCRTQALLGALFVASVFVFARWAACAKGDAFALALAGAGLARTLGRGRADATSGAFFASAFLVKPSVVGMGIGVLAASTALGRDRRWTAIGVATLIVAATLLILHVASGGVAIQHMRAALGLAFEPRLFFEHLASRTPIMAGLLVAATLAAWPSRATTEGRVALAALASSTCVAFFGLGKVGGSSAYLLEPALAAVVVLARFPLVTPTLISRALLAAALVLSLAWSGTATARSLVDERSRLPAHRPALARIRARCIDAPGAIIVSNDPGIELSLDGRVISYPIEMTNEARLGRFPAEVWAADVAHPAVRCVVNWTGERPPPDVPAGAFPAEVLAAMQAAFVLEGREGGYVVYRARSR